MDKARKAKEFVLGRPYEDVLSKYELGKELGRGQFGVTYFAKDKETGKEYACKSIAKHRIRDSREAADIRREVAIMDLLAGHPCIVKLKGAYEDPKAVHIVMELCTGGELYDRIVSLPSGHYSEREAARLCGVIVSVVQACHSHGVMHRDLKPENFLLSSKDPEATMKATDFGLSTFFKAGDIFTEEVGSAYYIAPEVLARKYGPAVDIWSAGVILYILLAGEPPFWGQAEAEIFHKVKYAPLNLRSHPWPTISEEAKSLVRGMLTRDPSQRLTAKQVLDHPWVSVEGVASARPLDNTVLMRLRKFAANHRLKKVALNYVASSLSEEEILGLRALFQAMDADGSGTITLDELKTGLEGRGCALGDNELVQLIESADVDQDGSINYTEFIAATMQKHHLDRNDRIFNAFKHFDKDDSGYLTADELGLVLKEHGVRLSDEQLANVILELDKDSDGRIDYNEFAAMMNEGNMEGMGMASILGADVVGAEAAAGAAGEAGEKGRTVPAAADDQPVVGQPYRIKDPLIVQKSRSNSRNTTPEPGSMPPTSDAK